MAAAAAVTFIFGGPCAFAFSDITGAPVAVEVVLSNKTIPLTADNQGHWASGDVVVNFAASGRGTSSISLTSPTLSVRKVHLHWPGSFDAHALVLSDTWERSYADLGWRALDPKATMPWYFLISSGDATDGYGVLTQPNAFCYWMVDGSGIDLWADVRSGSVAVELGSRTLQVCTVTARPGAAGESAFAAGGAFCRQMCLHPRIPPHPVYGFNDWYCAYGADTAADFLSDAAAIASLCPADKVKPFLVVDEGWQNNEQGGPGTDNPWLRTNDHFGSSMLAVAKSIVALNGVPGLWYRALQAWSECPPEWRLTGRSNVLDPSNPEVLQQVSDNVKMFKSWGYRLVKHDYSAFDLTGLWENQMRADIFPPGLIFADRTRTTAEIVLGLYRTIRAAGGDDMIIEGCNTFSHLSAGIFDLQRIGNDTSGRDWSMTLHNGVNCLAFRSIQNGAFYTADPDCVGLTAAGAIPWDKNLQWLRLVAHSGCPLFVSFHKNLAGPEQEEALRSALAAAAEPHSTAEPLDWTKSPTPSQWKLDGSEVTFTW